MCILINTFSCTNCAAWPGSWHPSSESRIKAAITSIAYYNSNKYWNTYLCGMDLYGSTWYWLSRFNSSEPQITLLDLEIILSIAWKTIICFWYQRGRWEHWLDCTIVHMHPCRRKWMQLSSMPSHQLPTNCTSYLLLQHMQYHLQLSQWRPVM